MKLTHPASGGAALLALTLTTTANSAGQIPDAFRQIDTELIALASGPPSLSAAVAVAQDGRIVWEAGYGFSDAARSVRTTAHTPFAVGSVAKTVTATALMRLVEKGVVDLERPVQSYLGNDVRVLQGDPQRLTPAALASMTGGIPHLSHHYWNDDAGVAPTAEQLVKEYGMAVFPPGDSFHYSNMSFGVLERLIEKVTGESFPQVVEREVFRPLAMTNSFFATPTERRTYAVRLRSSGAAIDGYVFTEPEGGAGLVASAHDLALLGSFHAGWPIGSTGILSTLSLQRMHRSVHPEAGYGLGMWASDYALIFDGAVLGGAGTVTVIPSESLAVSVVTNAVTDNPATYAFVGRLVEAALGSVGRKPRQESPPAFLSLQAFRPTPAIQGRWTGAIHRPGGTTPVLLVIESDGMRVSLSGRPLVSVEPSIEEGRIRFRYPGNMDDGSPPGTVTIRVQHSGTTLAGFAQAEPTARSGLAFPRYVVLERQ